MRAKQSRRARASRRATQCFMRAVDNVLRSPLSRGMQPGLAFVDTYALSLGVQDACLDGTHFLPDVMVSAPRPA